MNIDLLIKKAKKGKYVILSDTEIKDLLCNVQILREKETHISDKIRLLKFKDKLLIQEKTDKDEFLLRPMNTKTEAEEFIKQRIEIYDRMWDGCGCKVEYY
jgi:hypothetical protein